MAVAIVVTFDELELGSDLDLLSARLEDRLDLLDAIGTVLVEGTQRRFAAGRDPEGVPWKQSRRAALDGGQTLIESGRLLASITHNVESDGVRVGTNVRYGAIHQTGGTIKPRNGKALVFRPAGSNGFVTVGSVTIPARPYLGIDTEDRAGIQEVLEGWAEDALS